MFTKRIVLVAFLVTPLIVACGGNPSPSPSPSPPAVSPGQNNSSSPAIVVGVTLSDSAAEKISGSGETIIVSATYFADPPPGAASELVNDVGLMDLGREELELTRAGQVTLDGRHVDPIRLKLASGLAQVNVNVYSGRRSSPDNILDCDMFQDSVQVAARAPIKISCRLLSEQGGETG